MKNKPINLINLLCVFMLCGSIKYCNATSLIVKDTLHGSTYWNVDTVRIINDLVLLSSDSLIILPGTRVEFQGNFAFIADGIIIAKGLPDDSIVFTINDTSGFRNFNKEGGGWKMIQCNTLLPSQSRVFENCVFEYGKNITGNSPIIDFNSYSYAYPKQNIFKNNMVRNCYSKDTLIAFVHNGADSCIFANNHSHAFGGFYLYNSVISNNSGKGIIIYPRLSFISNGVGYIGRVKNCIVFKNTEAAISNGILKKSDPIGIVEITNNKIFENSQGISISKANVLVKNNFIYGQTNSGAVKINDASWTEIIQNLIFKNTLQSIDTTLKESAGIKIKNSSTVSIYNNTLTQNSGIFNGGLILDNFSDAKVFNNIFWDNSENQAQRELYFETAYPPGSSKLFFQSNLVENASKSIFISNLIQLDSAKILSADPLFIDKEINDFRPLPKSPIVDNGKNYDITWANEENNVPHTDLIGNPRAFNNQVDIGAYEYCPDSLLVINMFANNPDSIYFCENNYRSVLFTSGFFVPYTYQWIKDGKDIAGATYADLYLENITPVDAGTYSVHANNNQTELVLVCNSSELGEIAEHTIDLNEGTDYTIELTGLEENSLKFTWFKDGKPLENKLPGLLISKADLADEGYYYCQISNDCHRSVTDSVFVNVISNCEMFSGDTIIDEIQCSGYAFNGTYLTKSGIYMDTLVSSHGCDSIIKLYLTIPEINTDVEITDEGLKSLQADANYQWVNCDDVHILINGAINQTLIPELSGNYAVIVGLDGCSDTSDCAQYTKTGLVQPSAESIVSVYPNPFENITTIRLGSETEKIDEIRLIDVTGAIVFRAGTINSNEYIINNDQLKAGTYILQVINDSEIIIKQLIHL